MFSLDICFCWFEYFLFLVIKQGQRKLGGRGKEVDPWLYKTYDFLLKCFSLCNSKNSRVISLPRATWSMPLWLINSFWKIKEKAPLPRKWKGPAKILSGMETLPYDDVCHRKTSCRCIHLIVIGTVVNCKEDRFAQTRYQASRNIGQFSFKCCQSVKLWNSIKWCSRCVQW